MYSVSSFTFPSPSWLDQLLLPSEPHYDAFLSAIFSSAQSLVHTDNITSTNIDGAFWAGIAASPATLFLLILYMLLHALSLYPPNIPFFLSSRFASLLTRYRSIPADTCSLLGESDGFPSSTPYLALLPFDRLNNA